MPSVSGWALQREAGNVAPWMGFYALGVGLGFATPCPRLTAAADAFLCPRCRAGLSNRSKIRWPRKLPTWFYALGVGLGLATDAFLTWL